MQGDPEDLTPGQRSMLEGLREDAVNRFYDGDRNALSHSVALKPHDPAFWMLTDGKTSTPVVHQAGCYICEDPEFAAMGLPLCMRCPRCGGHVPADDDTCDECGHCMNPYTQTAADGLAPDGFSERVVDPDGNWDYPYGDFETSEPFRVVVGERYDGSPEYYGDYQEPEPPHEFELHDLVKVRCGDTFWRGEIMAIIGSRPETEMIFGPSGKQFLIVVTAPFTAGGLYQDGEEVLCTEDQLEYAGHIYRPRS